MSTDQEDALRAFYERRHPAYARMIRHWYFLKACYEGGRDWFADNIFRYYKEGETEFSDRLNRAYRFNHTREAVDLVQKYLFKAAIARKDADCPQVVKDFWERATLSGMSINQLMREVSTANSIGGRVALVIDNNMVVSADTSTSAEDKGRSPTLSVADVKKADVRIYAYTVPVEDILDMAFDEDGDGGLLWIKLRERVRDDADPINSSGDIIERVRLWTRNEWQLFEEREIPGATKRSKPIKKIEVIGSGKHDLGFVPVILVDHIVSSDPYRVPGLIDDIAYLDRAVANYLSNLDAIIQDQTFSQLAIPAQALQQGEDAYTKVLEMGTKRVFVFDGGAGSTAKPEYLSPDPKQAGVILTVINKIINEIYHTIGLAGERTKQDNAVGIDNSSGVAKAYDFERVNSLLTSKAAALENAENEAVRMVCAWAGVTEPKEKLVSYPTTFDVMRLVDELATAEALGKLQAPAEVRREQMRLLVDKLFPRLSEDLKETIRKDIDDWLDEDEVVLAPPSRFAGRSAATPSRQGQVTKNTPEKDASASK